MLNLIPSIGEPPNAGISLLRRGLVLGTIRIILALAVIATHSGLAVSVGGKLAVQLFYMISGFLISYILVEKQRYPNISGFYASRYLRLYPVYAVIAVATALAYAIAQPSWYDKFSTMPWPALVLLGVSQAGIFLLDGVMFTGIQNGNLVFVTDFMNSEPPLFTGLLVPQAWSLSLELAFYLIAPFVLKHRKLVFLLLGASIAVRLALLKTGLGTQDPWSYRFFPTELALFLAGALSHQLLLPFARSHSHRVAPAAITLFCGVFILLYSHLPIADPWREIVLFTATFATLPYAFVFQNANRWDVFVGNLSYPVYVNHLLVLNTCEVIVPGLGISSRAAQLAISLLVILALAVLLERFVSQRVDRWRAQLASRPANTGKA